MLLIVDKIVHIKNADTLSWVCADHGGWLGLVLGSI